MQPTFRLGRIAGITIGLHCSVVAVFWLLSWDRASGTLPAAAPGYGATAYWMVAAVATVLLLAGLLAHELAHSVVSHHHGIAVRRITLRGLVAAQR